MNTTNCYRCQEIFTGYGSLCSKCKQTELIQEEHEKNRKLQESIHSQNMALQKQAAQQAEYARQEAEYSSQINAQIAAESGVSSDDAYRYGLNYISLNWASGNNQENLSITIGEDGGLWFTNSLPYQLPHLNQSFTSGISKSLGQYTGPGRQFIEEMAYAAGFQIAKSELPSESFALGGNGVEIEGVKINTSGFSINLEKEINEATGELIYKYVLPPFKDGKLNSLFGDGMRDGTAMMNTSELMVERLKTDVPRIQELRKQEGGKKLISIIWFSTIFAVPILGWLIGWQITSGLQCFLTMVIYVPLATVINLFVYVAVFKDSKHLLWK